MMLSTGYGTDNESIQTEEFESRFMGMVVSPSDTEKGETMVTPLGQYTHGDTQGYVY